MFDHEQLVVHQKALDFAAAADALNSRLPPGRGYVADQLKRAVGSIVFNMGEGAGEWSPGEKVRFYRMALRSATECASILALVMKLRLVTTEDLPATRNLLQEIVKMLVALCRSVEAR